MKKSLIILVMAALAALASAQTPTTDYAQAKRQPHLDSYGVPHRGSGTYHVENSTTNIFVVEGSEATTDASGQSLPWGMTWANRCNNQWTFHKEDDLTLGPGDGIRETDDYYTIDKNYMSGTPNADPRNGDDKIVEGATSWTRTCASYVTNDVTWQVIHSS